MKTWIASILMCCLMVGPVSAQPTNHTSEAESMALQARDQFKAGGYEAAAKMFMDAYAKSHAPALIYNAARAYEEAGKKSDAITLFRMYITLSKDEAGIADAKARIAKLETVVPPVVQDQPKTPPPVKVRIVEVVRPLPPKPIRTAAWVASGGSVALVGIGLGLMSNGASGTRQFSGVNRSAFEAAQMEWYAGLGLLGAGVAVGGLSIYLWSKPPVTVTPTPTGVVVSGSF